MSKVAEVELIKGLNLLDATMLIAGSMIGSGIFIVSAEIARSVQSAGLLLLIWVVSGLMTVFAALSYGELSAAMPQAGGQYIFLKEAYGRLWGFLYGWTLFLVIQSGTIAAVAVAFARYLDVFIPLSAVLLRAEFGAVSFSIDLKQVVAVGVILLLSLVNCFGIRTGARVQNTFTVLKVFALIALIMLGLSFTGGSLSHFLPFWPDQASLRQSLGDFRQSFRPLVEADSLAMNFALLVGVAMIGALFSSDAWNNLTFTAGEVKNPQKTLPRALFLGTFSVTVLYLLANVAYVHVLPLDQIATTDKIGATVANAIFGREGNAIISAAILVSTFGCLNGLILSGPRVYYAMAKDRLFFGGLSRLNAKYHTPVRSLAAQALWASILTLSGTYNQLLTYVISAALVFYILTVLGVPILRRTRPDLPRPYRAIAYPWLPILYVMMAAVVLACNLVGDPRNSWPGFLIILLGLPAFFYWNRKQQSESVNVGIETSRKLNDGF
ncbi:MAG: amino acid permease [Acidobacteriota bacterium]